MESDENDDLERTRKIVVMQAKQIETLAKLMESQIAMREAQNTVIQALLLLYEKEERLPGFIEKIHQVRMAHHLNQEVSDRFIEIYQENVKAILPTWLRTTDCHE